MSDDEAALRPDTPQLNWTEQGVPRAESFDDVYFSVDGGLAETNYVFLEGNRLRERFAKVGSFTIAELGFGTGLNFLATMKLWKELHKGEGTLRYISFEKFPLERREIARAFESFPELAAEAELLFARYPRLVTGLHHLVFAAHGVELFLYIGDANELLPEIATCVDAWFLDGFSPSKNPELWSEQVFQELGRSSVVGSTFATFSAARIVRDRATEAGFSIKKQAGFGKKRDMLCGEVLSSPTKLSRPAVTEVLVIGGGLAGVSVAASLARSGASVELFERESEIATQASGNAAGIYMGYVAKKNTLMSRINLTGFDFLRRSVATLREAGHNISGAQCGVQHLVCNERLVGLHQQLLAAPHASGAAIALSYEEASEHLGLSVELPSIYYPEGGWLSPREFSTALLRSQEANITLRLEQDIDSLVFRNGLWTLLSSEGIELASAEQVVIANAYEAARLSQCDALPIGKIRGQTMRLPATQETRKLKQVLCYDGYIVPEHRGEHFLGSTYDKVNESCEIVIEQEDELLQRLCRRVPSLEASSLEKGPGRAAFRTTSPDRAPIVGALPGFPGLSVSLCHGSRGIITSGIAGELLSSQILGLPLPLIKVLSDTLSPARYLRKK